MAEIRELFNFGKLKIITEKSKLPKYALAKLSFSFAKADSKNLNNRTYPESLLAREINRKNEELRSAKIAGMLDHPPSGTTQLSRSMHAITAMDYDRRTKLASAESYVLDTENGKTFMTLLKSGIKLGASMRGFGNVGVDRRVKDDYKLDTVDFVTSPSFGTDAQIDQSNLIESFNPESKTDEERLIAVCEQLVEQGKFATVEKALEVINKEPETERKRLYTAENVAFEAGQAGVPIEEMVEILNENLGVRIKEITKREYSLMEELRSAGVKGNLEELLLKVRQMDGMKKILS